MLPLRHKLIRSMFTVSSDNKEWKISPDVHTGKMFINGTEANFEAEEISERYRKVTLNGVVYHVLLESFDKAAKTVTVRVNGERRVYAVKDRTDELLRMFGIRSFPVPKVNELKSPMPGLVVQILVKEGDTLSKGDPVVVLEAMKMENVLKSPADVVVKSIHAEPGKAVEKNAVLVRFT